MKKLFDIRLVAIVAVLAALMAVSAPTALADSDTVEILEFEVELTFTTTEDFEAIREHLGEEVYQRMDPDGTIARAVETQNSDVYAQARWTNPWNCRGKLSAAHASEHEDGTVDAVATTFYPNGFKPTIIGASASMEKERCFIICIWWPYGTSDSQERRNEVSVQAVADGPCVNARYRSSSSHWMLANGTVYSYHWNNVESTVTNC